MTLSLAEIQEKPSLVVDLLLNLKDVRLTIKSASDEVLVFPQRRYSDEVLEILRKSKELSLQRQVEGYTREQAFEDIRAVQHEYAALTSLSDE